MSFKTHVSIVLLYVLKLPSDLRVACVSVAQDRCKAIEPGI